MKHLEFFNFIVTLLSWIGKRRFLPDIYDPPVSLTKSQISSTYKKPNFHLWGILITFILLWTTPGTSRILQIFLTNYWSRWCGYHRFGFLFTTDQNLTVTADSFSARNIGLSLSEHLIGPIWKWDMRNAKRSHSTSCSWFRICDQFFFCAQRNAGPPMWLEMVQ